MIPRVIATKEWDAISAGLVQRLTALNLLIDDLYGMAALPALPVGGMATVDYLVDINSRVQRDVDYSIRMEPGVQTPTRRSRTSAGWRSAPPRGANGVRASPGPPAPGSAPAGV